MVTISAEASEGGVGTRTAEESPPINDPSKVDAALAEFHDAVIGDAWPYPEFRQTDVAASRTEDALRSARRE